MMAPVLAPVLAKAADTSAASAYFGNSLLCKSAAGGVCDLWLEPSGEYSVFYDSGKKAFVKDVTGPFQYEGRKGTYTASRADGGVQICLTPEAENPPRPSGASPALFHDAGCVTVPDHPLGEVWNFTFQGEGYKVGLIKGR
jgi:hypothetical protein